MQINAIGITIIIMMKNTIKVAEIKLGICARQIRYRCDAIGLERRYYDDEYGNPVRYLTDEDLQELKNWKGRKPGRKKKIVR